MKSFKKLIKNSKKYHRKYSKKNTRKNTRKYSKKIKYNKKRNIKRGGVNEVNGVNEVPTIFNFANADAQQKIQTFMLSNRDKIKSRFLKSVCSDSGVCIAFGTESNNIKNFFNNFLTFQYVVPPIIRVGEVSKNGFVNQITYEREGYKAYTILKSSVNKVSDNLLYEYLVGQYINKMTMIFPCFLETYGIYKYNTEQDWTYVKDNTNITTNIFKDNLTYLPNPTIAEGCADAQYLAILIQNLSNAKTMFQIMNNPSEIYFKYDLLNVLYQIYFPLSVLGSNFTHYDLHANNILLYEPVKNKYIQYYYHPIDIENTPITSFKCRYIVKIIDYGRCYFKDETTDSMKIYNEVCNTPECGGTACGVDNGFKVLLPEQYQGNFYYISSQQPNISHDMRILNTIKHTNYPLYPEVKEMLNDLNYETKYGTKEITDYNPNVINNVHDVLDALDQIINMEKWIKQNDFLYSKLGFEKIGDLHIYEDGRPMNFIPNK
jgi:hypothetical protein